MSTKNQIIVKSDFYGGNQGIDNILNDYYEREIRKIGNQEDQSLARKFIEEGLIIEGSRVSVSEASAISQFDLSEDLLQRLRDSRLIRAENTHLGKAYEVSHDTLVHPILKSFEKRKRAEDQIEIAKKIKEEHKAFEKEKRKKRRANLLAALGFLLFSVAMIALYKAIDLNKEIHQQSRIGKSSELTAHSVTQTQVSNNVTKGYALAKAALEFDDNVEARKALFSAYYKATNVPSNYFYTKDLNCQNSSLLSAYYSPQSNYIIANAWNKKACLYKKNGDFIRTFNIKAHKPIKRAVFSNNEKHLLVFGSENNEIEVYALDNLNEESEPIYTLKGHSELIHGAAFSSDDQKVLTYSKDGSVLLWNKDWQLEKEIKVDKEKIYYANFSPDGQHVLTINKSGNIQLFDEKGEFIIRIENEKGSTRTVSCSPNSNYFAIECPPNKVKIWNWEGSLVKELNGHEDFINDIDWSPDSKYIATSSPDKTAKIWDLKEDEPIANITGHHASVLSVDFSPNNQTLLTSSVDNTIVVWNLEGEIQGTLSGHFEKVGSAEFNKDGSRILSYSEEDNTVKEWVKENNAVWVLPIASEEAFIGKFSFNGQHALTCGSDIAMLWELEANNKVREKEKLTGHTRGVNYTSFSPNDQFVATGSLDNTGKVWDMEGQLIANLVGHKDQIVRIQWSPDSKEIITASHDKTAKIWNTNGDSLYTLRGHTSALLYAGFSPNGDHVITTSSDKTIKVWDRKGRLIQTLKGHDDRVIDAEISPNGRFIATASDDKTGRLWNLTEGTDFGKSIVLEGHTEVLRSIDISSDGNYIVTASDDRTARVWDRKGNLISVLSGHERRLQKAIFSNQGHMIATASSDNTAKVWALNGVLISDMIGHKNTVNDVNFSPDDKMILTVGSDHRAKIWPIISVDEVMRNVEESGFGGLDEETRKKYKID